MGIKDLLTKNKLKVFLNYHQNGNIWRMFFSKSGILVCETRDLEKKETYFFSLDYKSNEFYLKNFQTTEKWWVSIECVSNDNIFLSYFRKPDLPEHQGFSVIDIKTGEEKWKEPGLTYLHANDEEVYAYKQLFETKFYYKLSAIDGSILEEIKDNKEIQNILNKKVDDEKKLYSDFLYPEMYNEELFESEHTVVSYLENKLKDLKYIGELEILKFHDYLIYNYHKDNGIEIKDLNKRNLSNILEIYDLTADKLVYEDVLNENTNNYVPDSFFVKEAILFYIKEKKNLVTIKLN